MVTNSVGIIDYGAGNILNVLRAFESQGISTVLTSNPTEIGQFSHVVLPGVGAFDYGMRNLRKFGLSDALTEYVSSGGNLLGICLGMQLLADRGFENAESPGLGFFGGEIRHLTEISSAVLSVRIPNTGWSAIEWNNPEPRDSYGEIYSAYFNHSFFLNNPKQTEVLATSTIGALSFPAVVRSGNVFATQFHPEKSGPAGLALLRDWWLSRGRFKDFP